VSVAILIPARLESTRLARKLLLDATGKPLLAHTAERALEARRASNGLVTRVVVCADCEALAEAARAAGAEAVLTRPGHASGTDRIAEVAAGLEEDVLVDLQADEPEIDPAHVLACARLLIEDADAQMATLATPIASREEFLDPAAVKVVRSDSGDALRFSRAPIPPPRDGCDPCDVPAGALRHLGIYAYRREALLAFASMPRAALEEAEKLEQLRALAAGWRIRVAVVDAAPPGIDTEEDYRAFVARRRAAEGG